MSEHAVCPECSDGRCVPSNPLCGWMPCPECQTDNLAEAIEHFLNEPDPLTLIGVFSDYDGRHELRCHMPGCEWTYGPEQFGGESNLTELLIVAKEHLDGDCPVVAT